MSGAGGRPSDARAEAACPEAGRPPRPGAAEGAAAGSSGPGRQPGPGGGSPGGPSRLDGGPSGSRATLRWIWDGSGGDKPRVAAILVVETLQALLGLATAMLMRSLVDAAAAGDSQGLFHSTALLVGAFLALIALGGARRYLRDSTRSSLLNRFSLREFQTALGKDYGRVSSLHSGEWMNRMDSDAAVVADGVTAIVPDVASMLVRLVGAMALLLMMLPELAWVVIPGGCLLALLTFLFRGKLKRLHKDQQEAQGRTRVFLLDRLQSLLVVHSFSREAQEERGAAESMSDYRRALMRRSNFSNVCNMGFAAVMDGAYILGVCYCAWRMLQGSLSYGTLVAVMSLVSQVQSPFANISGYVPKYYAMLASAERLMEPEGWRDAFADQPRPAGEVAALYEGPLRSIELEGACFGYGEGEARRQVLDGLDARIPKGGVTCVTGPSGCGKSTLLKVLMGVYRLDEGSCVLRMADGCRPLDASWRGLFAYVPQGNQLMAGTIRQAVAFGDEARAADDEGVWAALRGACAEEFVRGLPEGLDTRLGEKGQGLSEGQVQRVAVARALYSGRPVLLLDEATSSLDVATERELLRNLKGLDGRTVVLVTHRPAALEVCDAVIDMAPQGRLAEEAALGER